MSLVTQCLPSYNKMTYTIVMTFHDIATSTMQNEDAQCMFKDRSGLSGMQWDGQTRRAGN